MSIEVSVDKFQDMAVGVSAETKFLGWKFLELETFWNQWDSALDGFCKQMLRSSMKDKLPGRQGDCVAVFRDEGLWCNKKINIWSLSLIPGTQFLKPWNLWSEECLLYTDEMTDGWGPLDSFSIGFSCQKAQGLIRGFELSALPALTSREPRGAGDWVTGQWPMI